MWHRSCSQNNISIVAGIGSDVNQNTLKSLCDKGKGGYVPLASGELLTVLFAALAMQIVEGVKVDIAKVRACLPVWVQPLRLPLHPRQSTLVSSPSSVPVRPHHPAVCTVAIDACFSYHDTGRGMGLPWCLCCDCMQIRTDEAEHIFARVERSRNMARVPVDILILVDISGSLFFHCFRIRDSVYLRRDAGIGYLLTKRDGTLVPVLQPVLVVNMFSLPSGIPSCPTHPRTRLIVSAIMPRTSTHAPTGSMNER